MVLEHQCPKECVFLGKKVCPLKTENSRKNTEELNAVTKSIPYNITMGVRIRGGIRKYTFAHSRTLKSELV